MANKGPGEVGMWLEEGTERLAVTQILYRKIIYFDGKQIKYVVSEHFADTFSIKIFVTCQIC